MTQFTIADRTDDRALEKLIEEYDDLQSDAMAVGRETLLDLRTNGSMTQEISHSGGVT